MKQKILALSGLVIFVAMLGWGTLAYFTASDRAINVLTIGSVDIEIKEYDQNGEEITDRNTTPESFQNIEPGQRIIKQVMIENRGMNPAWVRAKIIDSITAVGENGAPLSSDVLQYNVNDLYKPDAQSAAGDWSKDGDYWYFSQPVPAGETAVLFDVVTFNGPAMDNDYQGCTTKIQVIAQAVQYEGNEDRDPQSWPAEPEGVSSDPELHVSGGEQP